MASPSKRQKTTDTTALAGDTNALAGDTKPPMTMSMTTYISPWGGSLNRSNLANKWSPEKLNTDE